MRRLLLALSLTISFTVSAATDSVCDFLISPHAFVRVTAAALKDRVLLPEDLAFILASPIAINPLERIGDRHDNLGYVNAYKSLLGQTDTADNWPAIQAELVQLQARYLGEAKVSAAAWTSTHSLPEFRHAGTIVTPERIHARWFQTRDGRFFYTVESRIGLVRVFALGRTEPLWTSPEPMTSYGDITSAYGLSETTSGEIIFHHAAAKNLSLMGRLTGSANEIVVRDYNIGRNEPPAKRTFQGTGLPKTYRVTRSGVEFLQLAGGVFLSLGEPTRELQLDASSKFIWVGESANGRPLVLQERGGTRRSQNRSFIFWQFDGHQWIQLNDPSPLLGDDYHVIPLPLSNGKIALVQQNDSGIAVILDALDKPSEKVQLASTELSDLELFENADGRVFIAGVDRGRKSFEVFEPSVSPKPILRSTDLPMIDAIRWFADGNRAFLAVARSEKIELFEPAAGLAAIVSVPNKSARNYYSLISDGKGHAYWISASTDADDAFSLLGRVTDAKP